jgi:hypothetical protein
MSAIIRLGEVVQIDLAFFPRNHGIASINLLGQQK